MIDFETITINLFIINSCNMQCHACHSHFSKNDLLSLDMIEHIVDNISESTHHIHNRKITLVGGEPLLHPELLEICSAIKQRGFSLSIISNGLLIDDALLGNMIHTVDAIGISIDSFTENTNRRLGRTWCGQPIPTERYIEICHAIKAAGFYLKVNTVLSQLNLGEDMTRHIQVIGPDRWKVFQYVYIDGENDQALSIGKAEVEAFQLRHKDCDPIIENSDDIRGSYLMVDPKGRLFDSAKDSYRYSDSLLTIPFLEAIKQINFDYGKFIRRGGVYQIPTARCTE